MKERNLQRKILDCLRSMGGWWLNFHGGDVYMPRGIPDIIGCYEGRFFALEVKLPGEEPTSIQRHMLKTISDAGAVTAVVRSVEEAEKIVKEECL